MECFDDEDGEKGRKTKNDEAEKEEKEEEATDIVGGDGILDEDSALLREHRHLSLLNHIASLLKVTSHSTASPNVSALDFSTDNLDLSFNVPWEPTQIPGVKGGAADTTKTKGDGKREERAEEPERGSTEGEPKAKKAKTGEAKEKKNDKAKKEAATTNGEAEDYKLQLGEANQKVEKQAQEIEELKYKVDSLQGTFRGLTEVVLALKDKLDQTILTPDAPKEQQTHKKRKRSTLFGCRKKSKTSSCCAW